MAKLVASSDWAPKVIVPRQTSETFSPVRPNRLIFMWLFSTLSPLSRFPRFGSRCPPFPAYAEARELLYLFRNTGVWDLNKITPSALRRTDRSDGCFKC